MTQKDIRILYADADARNAEAFIGHLHERGHKRIKHFENGPDLEQEYLLHPRQYDLIVIHHTMPGVEGVMVLENLRAARHKVPAIILASDIFLEDKIKENGGVYIWNQDSQHMKKIEDVIQSLRTVRPKSQLLGRTEPRAVPPPAPEPPPA